MQRYTPGQAGDGQQWDNGRTREEIGEVGFQYGRLWFAFEEAERELLDGLLVYVYGWAVGLSDGARG